MRKIFLIATVVFLFGHSGRTQTVMLHNLPGNSTSFSVKFQHPFFTRTGSPLYSGIYEVFVNTPIGEKYGLEMAVPFSYSSMEGFYEDGVGNVYIGLQTRKAFADNAGSSGAFGLFLPTAYSKTEIFGSLANFINYYKYVSETVTIYGNYAYRTYTPTNVMVTFEIGPALTIPISDEGRDANLLLHYGGGLGFELQKITLFTELTGLMIINEYSRELSDRFTHSFGFGMQYKGHNFRPAIFFNLYLKENLSDVVDGVLSLKIEVGRD
ncbi:MAG TPA: hypothetical protein ENK44_12910 [Caldithrix abyssi]|uniref:Uncharacterized protein n=1 Tax=Caldithrix abyssi TaxID=187145 RepID=A0A7V4UEU5_CALAY|nr:hypothetical protein [Caldithrix abyssi]